MIDIHCHILPGVDDGPETLDESVMMAKLAVKEGVSTIIATPHHKNNSYINPKNTIVQDVERLNEVLVNENIPLKILPGQEIRIFGEILEDHQKGEILTLNNSDYIFIEFPSSSVPRYSEKLLYDIQLEGFKPIIVHPERNKELLENPTLLYNLVKNGALTQVTAGSISGYFGKTIKKFSQQLIESNLTHFVASDAHNIHNRSFKLQEAFEYIENKMGKDYVHLFAENCESLITNQSVYREIPEPIKKKKFLGVF